MRLDGRVGIGTDRDSRVQPGRAIERDINVIGISISIDLIVVYGYSHYQCIKDVQPISS